VSESARLAARLRELLTHDGVPGVAAVHVSRTGVEAVAVDGVRRVDRRERVELGDRFHIGSNTKAMTALLAALAVEDGRLGWDTGAAEVLGGMARSPTLRQLLTHSAGLAGYGDDEEIAAVVVPDGSPPEQRAAFARIALAEPPLSVHGTSHAYSNAGYAIAAAMVEEATGEAWEEAIGSRIFVPLDIDGRVGWPCLHAADAPLGHRLVDGALQAHHPATDGYALPAWARPAGDVSLSIVDYGTFLVDQMSGLAGRGRLGSEAMYATLHAADAPDEEGGVGYALGWGVRHTDSGPMSMHSGSADTFYAIVVLAPQLDRGIGVVANSYTEAHEGAVNALVKEFLVGDSDQRSAGTRRGIRPRRRRGGCGERRSRAGRV
jgi:CubicO group peptidase (beta-lactamase class C family)